MPAEEVALTGDGSARAGEENPNNANQFQLIPLIKSMATRIIMVYVISSVIKNFFGPKQQISDSNVDSNLPAKIYPASMNMYSPGELFNFYMFISPKKDNFDDFDDSKSFLWQEHNLIYGDWSSGPNSDGSRVKSITMETPPELQNNGSIYMHVYFVKSGQSPVPRYRNYGGREVVYATFQLNKFKKKFYKRTSNLLTGKTEQSEDDLRKADQLKYEVLNFWHPNITVNFVTDFTAWTNGQLPAPLDEAVKFDVQTNRYYPIVFFNTYWNLGSEYIILNETVKNLNLTVTFAPLSLFKWQLYASQQMRGKWSSMLGGDIFEENDDDQDAIKQALLETNPMLLAVTVIVSILHTILEFLAFKNDIQFWRTRKTLEGLSVRTVLFNVFQSLIVFLYICDNDSSWVIKISIGFGLLIELWKIPKCLNVEIDRNEKIFAIIPKIRFTDKGSYVESATKDYDQMAFKYLSWVLFPLLGGYAVYSLIYEEQRGWYSWILSMLYGFLLMFGFIMMTPQLFINYKLKSVAHLPWRMLTYKFINTFIDDLFAFVIRMPTMYRIGCFRDDIIFLVYIYQRWIYRVDPTRVNEYGTSMEGADDKNEQRAIDAPPSANDASAAVNEAASASADEKVETCAAESKKDK